MMFKNKKKCLNCENMCKDDVKYCTNCGSDKFIGVDSSFLCSNCGDILKESSKYCTNCGSNITLSQIKKEDIKQENTQFEEKPNNQWKWILVIVFILILIGIAVLVFSNTEIRKSVCGTHPETYTSSVAGCDDMQGCRCLHKSWGGLGVCDSCECTKEVNNC